MGFTIVEPIQVVRLGMSVSNVYVTLRGCSTTHKTQDLPAIATATLQFAPEIARYHLTARMVFYSGKQYQGLMPLHEENVTLSMAVYPVGDPMTLLYGKAKSLFPNYTIVDDMS